MVSSIEGLARKTLFATLADQEASRAARLIYKYAEGTMQLDPERPDGPDIQMLGIRVGVEQVSREHVFKSLPVDLQGQAAILLLKYASREKGVGSPHFPLEDLTGSIVKRARRALGRNFVADSLPLELREQAVALHEKLKGVRR